MCHIIKCVLKSLTYFNWPSYTNIWEILTKSRAPQTGIRSLRLPDALKLSSKQIELSKGIHLKCVLKFVFKNFREEGEDGMGGLKSPKYP